MSESDWGDDSWDLPAPVPPAEDDAMAEPVEQAASMAATGGVDVASAAREAVDGAVRAAVRKQVKTIAEEAVEAALTDELVESLRDRARDSAAAAVEGDGDEPEADDGDGEEPAPELVYGSVDEFLREYLRYTYRRRIDGKQRVWAACWWQYDEAVIRLEALWRSWEHLRLDAATGMSVWWRDHADHHMAVLMDPQGPFQAVKSMDDENQCEKGKPLPYKRPPEGLFPDVRKTDPAPSVPDPDPGGPREATSV